jgi:hypothetical protein
LYQRSKFAQTAFALNAVPSWNFTPVRRLNVHVFPSFDCVQLVARSGRRFVVPGTCDTSVSTICLMTRIDSPSFASEPSSETGSADAPNTSVSPACERSDAA